MRTAFVILLVVALIAGASSLRLRLYSDLTCDNEIASKSCAANACCQFEQNNVYTNYQVTANNDNTFTVDIRGIVQNDDTPCPVVATVLCASILDDGCCLTAGGGSLKVNAAPATAVGALALLVVALVCTAM